MIALFFRRKCIEKTKAIYQRPMELYIQRKTPMIPHHVSIGISSLPPKSSKVLQHIE
jgi:hypothetical protein